MDFEGRKKHFDGEAIQSKRILHEIEEKIRETETTLVQLNDKTIYERHQLGYLKLQVLAESPQELRDSKNRADNLEKDLKELGVTLKRVWRTSQREIGQLEERYRNLEIEIFKLRAELKVYQDRTGKGMMR